MYGLNGSFAIVISIIILWMIITAIKRRSRTFSTTTLVLTDLKINSIPEEGTLIFLKGRHSGFISWILTMMKLASDASLWVTTEKIHFQSASLSGDAHAIMSIKNGISSINCEYYRPILNLIWAAVLILLSLIGGIYYHTFYPFLVSLLFAFIFGLFYYLNKNISINIETKGGSNYRLKFKPSLIENIGLDINKATEIVEIINNQLIMLQK